MYNKKTPDGVLLRKPTRLMGPLEIMESLALRCSQDHPHARIEGSVRCPDGRRRNLSEWAGGYSHTFASQMLYEVELYLGSVPRQWGVRRKVNLVADAEDAQEQEEIAECNACDSPAGSAEVCERGSHTGYTGARQGESTGEHAVRLYRELSLIHI